MQKCSDLSIRHKLTIIILLTSGFAIMVFSLFFILNEAISLRQNAWEHISALARITGIDSTAALSFQDPDTAKELLGGLRVEPSIKSAAIYTASGDRFAVYIGKDGTVPPLHISPTKFSETDPKGFTTIGLLKCLIGLDDDFMQILEPIMLNGRRIGSVFIRSDSSWIHGRIKSVTVLVAGVMLLLLLLSFFISAKMKRTIAHPIETLSSAMKKVKQRQDYSLRISSDRNDELGTLMDGFNDMLEQIQKRDRELEENRKNLEQQIILRTEALKLSENQKQQLVIQRKIQEAYGELVSHLNTIDLDFILGKSLLHMADQANAVWGGVYLYDAGAGELRLKKTFLSEKPPGQKSTEGIEKEAQKLALKTFEKNASLPEWIEIKSRGSRDSSVQLNAYPLYFQDMGLGVMVLAGTGELDPYTREFMKNASRQIGVAIHNALTFEDLRSKSVQLERASRMKSQFLANMSHELRTPLNAIIGFSELLSDEYFGKLTDTQKDYLNDILESARHLLALINDILDLSKVEAGKMELDLTQVRVEDLLNSSLTMIKEKALKHDLHLSIKTENCPESIDADARKLKQVIYNLISNAAKFTEDGGSIEIRASEVSRSWIKANLPEAFKHECLSSLPQTCETFLKISVEDTGIGIEAEALHKIFSAFEQVDSSISKAYEGTGLGLALCKRFIQLHHGAIWVKSEPGKGSTFTFVIPCHHDFHQMEKKREQDAADQNEKPV